MRGRLRQLAFIIDLIMVLVQKEKHVYVFGLSLFLFRDTSSPALLNSLSEGTDVANKQRYFLARGAN